MSQSSSILALPYLQPSQAQKHVTHNEALRRLDIIVQLGVVSFGATTPPGAPAEGEVYALGAGTSGVWAGHDSELAAWLDGVWLFLAPLPGWRAWGQAETELRLALDRVDYWTGVGAQVSPRVAQLVKSFQSRQAGGQAAA